MKLPKFTLPRFSLPSCRPGALCGRFSVRNWKHTSYIVISIEELY